MIRSGVRYKAVEVDGDVLDEEKDMKRKYFTPGFIWVSLRTTILIAIYFAPSVGLTFYQRWLFQSFHFPLSVVVVHLCVKYFLASFVRYILTCCGRSRAAICWRDHIVAVAPTGLFSGIDIGFSNWGLELVTVSLYTMTKSTVVVFILLFAIIFKLEKWSWSLCFIVVMISTGLILFTFKATHFNIIGFILILFASMSSGIRWTCVQLLLQKSNMDMSNPIDMIYHMQPWMLLSVFPFAIWIEGLSLITSCQAFRISDYNLLKDIVGKVLLGAFIAFFMELSEVLVVMYTSSLTLSVSGIFKEIFILTLAVKWNGDILSPINLLGLVVCLLGIISHVIHKIRTNRYQNPNSRITYKSGIRERFELEESLVNDVERMSFSSNSDNENSDSNVLFDILNRRER